MKVVRFAFQILVVGLALLTGQASAKTLPLPGNLISLTSEQGEELLLDSEALQAYWPLSVQFVTQRNLGYCGVAAIVMVLNALGIEGPPRRNSSHTPPSLKTMCSTQKPRRCFPRPC